MKKLFFLLLTISSVFSHEPPPTPPLSPRLEALRVELYHATQNSHEALQITNGRIIIHRQRFNMLEAKFAELEEKQKKHDLALQINELRANMVNLRLWALSEVVGLQANQALPAPAQPAAPQPNQQILDELRARVAATQAANSQLSNFLKVTTGLSTLATLISGSFCLVNKKEEDEYGWADAKRDKWSFGALTLLSATATGVSAYCYRRNQQTLEEDKNS